jgi:hypothetical protein
MAFKNSAHAQCFILYTSPKFSPPLFLKELLLNEMFVVIYKMFLIISGFFYVVLILCYLTFEPKLSSDVAEQTASPSFFHQIFHTRYGH